MTHGSSDASSFNRDIFADCLLEGKPRAGQLLWRLISVKRGWMIGSIVTGTLSALLQIAPSAFAALMTASLLKGDQQTALWMAFGMALSAIVAVGFFSWSTMLSHLIAADVQADLRHFIADKLQHVSLGFFASHSPGELRKILLDDVEEMEDGIAHLIPEITTALVAPLIILIVMLLLDWKMALAATLPTIAGFAIFSVVMGQNEGLTQRFYETQARINTSLSEIVSSIPLVKSYGQDSHALKKVRKAFADFEGLMKQWIDQNIVKSNWFFLFTSSNLVAVVPLGIYWWHGGMLSLPVLVFFILASMALGLVVSTLFGLMNRIEKQRAVLENFAKVVNQPELSYSSAPQMPDGCLLEFDKVYFSYSAEDSKQQAIEDFSLTVQPGQSIAIVGPSGAGKSTLARLLARFWDVDKGAIRIGGVDIRDISAEDLSRYVSFVFQEVFLFSQSVADNLRIGDSEASDEQLVEAAKAAQAHDFIMQLEDGYQTNLHGGEGLSVGQKQRLAIARALLRKAPILILDEATAFADPQNERELQKAIGNLAIGKTLVIIAHRLSTIQTVDHIVYMQDGRIAEQGTHKALLEKKGAFAAQWEAHMASRQFVLTNKDNEEAASSSVEGAES